MTHAPLDVSTLCAMLEHAPGFITLLDPEFRVRYVNRTAHGYTLDMVLGQSVFSFYGPEEAARVRKAFEHAVASRAEQSIESFVDLPHGERLWFSSLVSVLHDESDQLVGLVQITMDITAHKRAELHLRKIQVDLLEASHRAGMAEVATGVLHNVGNVLNSVNVSVATLLEKLTSPHLDMLGRAVRMCEEQGESLPLFLAHDPRGSRLPTLFARLHEQLVAEREELRAELEYMIEHIDTICSVVESQQSVARSGGVLEEIGLDDLLERALSMFRLDLASHHIALSLHVHDSRRVILDKQSTLQILVNLIRNAIEALEGISGPRKLAVEVHSRDELIHFEVIDNGVGIASDHLDKLFRHGFTTKKSGHGFGLHASAVSAHAMGGTLEAMSEGVGRGARFRLSLPRRQALD